MTTAELRDREATAKSVKWLLSRTTETELLLLLLRRLPKLWLLKPGAPEISEILLLLLRHPSEPKLVLRLLIKLGLAKIQVHGSANVCGCL